MKNTLSMVAIVVIVVCLVVNISSFASPDRGTIFDFMSTPQQRVPQDPRVVREGVHPCGLYASARVSKMPRAIDRQRYVIPDLVVKTALDEDRLSVGEASPFISTIDWQSID
jgi:hypothetical protein